MQPLKKFSNANLRFVFTDIDDTLTSGGLLSEKAYLALWQIFKSGINVVPVTGRPAGWCELIARQWPVAGVVGENGGFYFRYHNKKMIRHFFNSDKERATNRKKLDKVAREVLKKVPGSAVASDQFSRLMDLAIDHCEDVTPLSDKKIKKIVSIFASHGARSKVSSIHVNGWFGDYDKLSMVKTFCKREFSFDLSGALDTAAFVGDSPNDEPMFEYFKHSFGVANIGNFLDQMKHLPKFVSASKGGDGFAEVAEQILRVRR